MNPPTLAANAWLAAANDQTMSDSVNPKRVPILSISQPAKRSPMA